MHDPDSNAVSEQVTVWVWILLVTLCLSHITMVFRLIIRYFLSQNLLLYLI